MTDIRIRLRTGLGAAILIAGAVAGAPSLAASSVAGASGAAGGVPVIAAASQAEPLPTAEFVAGLGAVEGHLRVGGALYADGKVTDALVHFRRPLEVLYAGLKPSIAARDVPDFKPELEALLQAARAGQPAAEISRRIDAVLVKLRAATASVPVAERRDIHTGLKVASLLLGTIADTYGAAVVDGRIADATDYQASLGYMQVTAGVLRQAAPRFKDADPERWTIVARDLTRLAHAWPSLLPPEQPALTVAEVQALVVNLRQQLDTF
ncbi:hypothetical protein P7L78_17605 [Tistrella bauzanensis]|uniref:Uncharacterized protein n=1 Tax=Tistrella arctica TaxID=3133430 RepID=A0ABU9YDW1_9PROT